MEIKEAIQRFSIAVKVEDSQETDTKVSWLLLLFIMG